MIMLMAHACGRLSDWGMWGSRQRLGAPLPRPGALVCVSSHMGRQDRPNAAGFMKANIEIHKNHTNTTGLLINVLGGLASVQNT